jgi:hypothetical protein
LDLESPLEELSFLLMERTIVLDLARLTVCASAVGASFTGRLGRVPTVVFTGELKWSGWNLSLLEEETRGGRTLVGLLGADEVEVGDTVVGVMFGTIVGEDEANPLLFLLLLED